MAMAQRKSTPIILIGVAVFVVGAALAFVLLHGHSHKSKTSKGATSTRTVVTGSSGGQATTASTIPTFTLDPGTSGVAVSMAFFPGGGGYVHSGSFVDVYAVVKGHGPLPGAGAIPSAQAAPPFARLILHKVKVLEAIGTAPSTGGAPTSFLLELTPGDAEQVIFYQNFESLYFTLVQSNSPAVPTPGRSYANS